MTKPLTEEEKKKRKADREAGKIKPFDIKEEDTGETDLKVSLTQDERNKFSQHLAKVTRELMQVKLNKAEVMKDYGARIAKLEADINETASKVADGFEFRPIKCKLRYHFPEGKKFLIRKDTNEVISERDITDKDRQMHFPEVKSKKKEGDKKDGKEKTK
jgi:hypothetical protein